MIICPLLGSSSPKNAKISPTSLLAAVSFRSPVLPTAVDRILLRLRSQNVLIVVPDRIPDVYAQYQRDELDEETASPLSGSPVLGREPSTSFL